MRFIRSSDYTGEHAWDALDIEEIQDSTVRLHWTNEPYKWHVNDGAEVFAVLDGSVDMFYRENGEEKSSLMVAGDICHATPGDEHKACPVGTARILVIEKKGSV